VYYGLSAGAPNPKSGGAGNAYAMIFVNTADPTVALAQAQIDKLAYADCTAGGMMMSTCMTGTTMAGYMQMGTMMAEPVSQTTTER
jgi:nucleoside permease NupC